MWQDVGHANDAFLCKSSQSQSSLFPFTFDQISTKLLIFGNFSVANVLVDPEFLT